MRKPWMSVALGEVAGVLMGQSPPGSTYNTGENGRPFLQGSAEFGPTSPSPIKFTTARQARACHEGDLLISVRAPVGDLNVADRAYVIGRGLAAIRGSEAASTPFLALAIEHSMVDLDRLSSSGMFKSITKSGLLSLSIPLPPLPEQRRVVDLLASIDNALGRTERLLETTRMTLLSVLADTFPAWPDTGSKSLGHLAEMRSGHSWAASDEMGTAGADTTPVLKITNTKPGGHLDLSEVVHVRRLPQSTRRLRPSDLILIRTNGNRARIGNVYRTIPECEGFSFSSFQIGIFPTEPQSQVYLYWALSAPWVQAAITDAASGSTGLGNIAISWLRQLPVYWPSESERLATAELLDSIRASYESTRSQIVNLRGLRSSLLTELLSAQHPVPASYDRFLQETA